MYTQRSGLPLLFLAAIIFLIAAAIVVFIVRPFGPDWSLNLFAARGDRVELDDPVDSQPATTSAPEQTEPAEVASETTETTQTNDADADTDASVGQPAETTPGTVIEPMTYQVEETDSLFDIAGAVWGDPHLWPLIYVANEEQVVDPDYLRPGQQIQVPRWVTLSSGLTSSQRRELSAAHVEAHQMYKELGSAAIGLGAGQPEWWLRSLGRERANKAEWVLYSGLRYNEDLLSDFEDQIASADRARVQSYVERFGLPPDRR